MNIGIMQGRLLPKYHNRYQAFPVGYWQSEFFIAKELGFQCIEFILDYDEVELNPLMSKNGIIEILNIINKTGIKVFSICADYFMEAPFHSTHQSKSEDVLETLIFNAATIGAKDIVIPCVDQSSLKSEIDLKMFEKSIKKILPISEKFDININIEADLNPADFKNLLNKFSSPKIKVNYDTGNSASLNYKPKEEIEAYGKFISDLHIKDRVINGGSVELGKGSADFDLIFSLLKNINYDGNIIMQAARADSFIDDLLLLKKQKKKLETKINKHFK